MPNLELNMIACHIFEGIAVYIDDNKPMYTENCEVSISTIHRAVHKYIARAILMQCYHHFACQQEMMIVISFIILSNHEI